MIQGSLDSFLFGTADDYHELNAGAHKKPPKNLNAPALVWHTASWIRDSQVLGSVESARDVKDTVDDFILTLCRVIAPKVEELSLSPCINGVSLLFNCVCPENSFERSQIELDGRQRDVFKSTSRAVSIKFGWYDLDVAIRFDIHTEYLAVSTFVELDKRLTGARLTTLPELAEYMERMLEYLKTGNRELANPLNGYLFKEFWQRYESELLSDPSLADFRKSNPCGQIFADFRGIVASEQGVEFPDTDEFLAGESRLSWGFAAKSRLLPLIQDERRYECAVNYLLDGRAFYMSTLGPQLPSKPTSERIPLEFIVYATQRSRKKTIVNKWQLGRLVSEMLLLETLRLCALKDVGLLHEAGRELSRLDESTQKAREAIASKKHSDRDARKDPASVSPENLPSGNEAMELIQQAHEKLNDITGKFLNATGSGLLYRIERSRYYVKQFKDTVELLRIKRLEGDQPYDQFVERRLGSEFDFIDRLGIRYERATRNIVTLDQNYLAISQNALVEKANRIDEETKGIQGDIHTIQEWGEFALLAALVPYYVMHLLDLVIHEELVPGMTLGVWTVFGALALYRKFDRYRYPIALVATIGLVVGTSLVLGRYKLYDYSHILRSPEEPGAQLKAQTEILGIHKRLEKLQVLQNELQKEQTAVTREVLDVLNKQYEVIEKRPTGGPDPKN